MTREQEILNNIIKLLIRRVRCTKIMLFGSRAKNCFPNNADFDLAIDSPAPGIRGHRKIMEEIDKIAGLYKVDVIYLNNVDKTFRDIILRTGKKVYEKGSQVCGQEI